MPAAPLPTDETERLFALHQLRILDTPQDENFGIFPALAAALFDAPVSAVSFIDAERHWFKAAHGLDATQVPRAVSFCAHAILVPGQVIVVPDATRDARFADNPLVTDGPRFRFYAGAPIIDRTTGAALGALCVLDHQPREITPAWIEQLRRLAHGVGSAAHLHGMLNRLQAMTLRDPLTGAGNRVALEAQVAQVFDAPPGTDPAPGRTALMFLDLDRFKTINDLFGHAGGDAALTETVRRIRQVLRPTDFVARLGGDEFCVLLDGCEESDAAETVAARIHAALAEPFLIDGKAVPLNTSIGIAFAPDDAADTPGLLARADEALYAAKHAGRGTTRLFRQVAQATGPAPAVHVPGRRATEQMLKAALLPTAHKPFTLRFQPFFDAATRALAGFEALVRWPLPDGTELQPGAFIQVAERTGLVVQLDEWVLQEACREAAAWRMPLTIATNLSAANFFASDIVETITAILARTGLPPTQLKLEITESVLLRDAERVRAAIVRLQDLGIQFALDDFGAGHASLAYLRDFPIDEVKIDRGFIDGADQDDRKKAFFRAIIDMCQAMKVNTLAEGVETEQQLALVRRLKVGSVQGFLLGRPLEQAQARDLADTSPARSTVASMLQPVCV